MQRKPLLLIIIWGQYLCNVTPQTYDQSTLENVTMSTLLDDLFKGYDKKLPPRYNRPSDERTVNVTANIFIISMFSVSEMDMIDEEYILKDEQWNLVTISKDYSLSMFLRERWMDERLVYNDVLNLTRLEIDVSLFDKVWVPDLFIISEKYSDFHEVTIPNKMLHIYPDGTVQYSARVTGSFFCVMDLRKYPFDTQYCSLELESYGQTTKSLRFLWDENPLTLAPGIKFPQFDLTDTQLYTCDKQYYGIAFPCIGLKFVLVRNYAYYIIQIYVPSILIVILSWVNFWLDCTSVPGRVSLALLTVLTMTTQSAGARANLPRVSYIKAIDVWMAMCLTFVFLGLLEFAYVNVQSRVQTRRRQSVYVGNNKIKSNESDTESRNGNMNPPRQFSTEENKKSFIPCFKHLQGLERARAVDKISRVVFPLSFGIFNLIYWIYYFTWQPEFKGDIS